MKKQFFLATATLSILFVGCDQKKEEGQQERQPSSQSFYQQSPSQNEQSSMQRQYYQQQQQQVPQPNSYRNQPRSSSGQGSRWF